MLDHKKTDFRKVQTTTNRTQRERSHGKKGKDEKQTFLIRSTEERNCACLLARMRLLLLEPSSAETLYNA